MLEIVKRVLWNFYGHFFRLARMEFEGAFFFFILFHTTSFHGASHDAQI